MNNNKLVLDDADITQVCLSLIDRVMMNYKNITRIRPLNGNFIFISGLFKEENANESIVKMIQFANEVAYSINSYTECESLVTCVMSYGGPVYGCMTGISKTVFDVFGMPLVECFDMMDLAPPGKILFVDDAYEMIDDKSKLSPFKANRLVEKKLFVLNSYIGMDFVQDQ
ncbi:guanylate cyclase protein [Trichomonas vaginalis G3]|uniref:guanylate cyclase protein n=1 Tax=Trichomonas vaginalis (strain ATCC PRA-98 / G3) TaxID=412133 RepID=UPI0021E5508C|nr:guanylate cyclase protein [Trichomonas vaginalis G3]KAI5512360.1 guanylate cyclase protein [Trichomonas vaginalis G3]